jgi:hypothetical protein
VVEEGSFGARLIVVLLVTIGTAANVWYQGRLWRNGLRLWHGVVLGLAGGVFVGFVALE